MTHVVTVTQSMRREDGKQLSSVSVRSETRSPAESIGILIAAVVGVTNEVGRGMGLSPEEILAHTIRDIQEITAAVKEFGTLVDHNLPVQ